MGYRIAQGETNKADFTFYGGARDFASFKGAEAILHGPAETGKTISALYKVHICACKYPGASIVILRKTLASIYSTVLQTYMNKVLGPRETWPCEPYGGDQKPQWFNYWNGSRVWLAGMDKSSKVLSAEHDLILWVQCEEGELHEWETLTTRVTGRAGNMPYSQLLGDMNPTFPRHWPYHRNAIRLIYSKHKDNPTLFDPVTGEITEKGERTMSTLEELTGARRARLLEGRPAQVEGAVYDEYDEVRHLKYVNEVPKFYRYVAGIDWGYRNPGVIGVWGIDGRNGAMYLAAQIYRTGETDDWWLERALELDKKFVRIRKEYNRGQPERLIEAWVCDPSEPAYIRKFRDAGLNAVAGFNAVLPGITALKNRLGSEPPLFYIVRDCQLSGYVDQTLKADFKPARLRDEFTSYVWADSGKETPVKKDDHGLDMARYVVCYLDDVGQKKRKKAGTW